MDIAGLNKKSDEVLICTDEIVCLTSEALFVLKQMASISTKKRARICAHKSSNSTIQEMIIVINRGSYVRPHRHRNKCESFHLIDGAADIVIFEDDGSIKKIVPFTKAACFYYRLDDAYFHTIVVRSEIIVFHEVTNGPFVANETEYADFSPIDGEEMTSNYCGDLDKKILNWVKKNGC